MESPRTPARQQRLAKALRANLLRRKQSRPSSAPIAFAGGRANAPTPAAPPPAPPSAPANGGTLIIEGGTPLVGEIPISGAKNAALPLLIASLLTDQEMHLHNIPRVSDVRVLLQLLATLGCRAEPLPQSAGWKLQTPAITCTTAPYEILAQMRAGFWVIAPLLARCREACVSLPGGCAIGARPVNLYMDTLQSMGAKITLEEGYIHASAPQGLHAAHIDFPFVSVGATHVAAMAASLAKGETIIENAAREPEVTDLLNCLRAMGADIQGAATSRLHIRGSGGELLHATTHHAPPDRIEAGTYAIAVAMTGGEALLSSIRADMLGAAHQLLQSTGVQLRETATGLHITRHTPRPLAVSMETAPWPGFPTDLQAQFMALMTLAEGQSVITETIFENRFMHVAELARMGADISLHRDQAVVRGVPSLTGAAVEATDLRASVSLALAGLAAQGETRIGRIHHLHRGFEDLESKLSACGARIRSTE